MFGKRTVAVAVSMLAVSLTMGGCSLVGDADPVPMANIPAVRADAADEDPDEPGQDRGYHVLMVGDEAPDFSVDIIGGKNFTLSEQRGKVVFINFWATWCGPCIDEMPEIETLYGSYARDDLEVVAVNSGEKISRIEQFLDQSDYSFFFAADETFEIGDKYPTSGIPYTVVVDPDGMISDIFLGSHDGILEDFKAAVDRALAE